MLIKKIKFRRPASWQRYIHPAAIILQGIGIWIGWKYLPPHLLHNPGLQIILAAIVLSDAAHYFLHDK